MNGPIPQITKARKFWLSTGGIAWYVYCGYVTVPGNAGARGLSHSPMWVDA